MKFGRVENVDAVDFTLPPDATGNRALLGCLRAREGPPQPRVLVGTSGWSNRDFATALYPAGTRAGDYLRAYADAFPTNELNSTFYGYDPMRLAQWAATVPEDFVFCPKLPATISHERELAGAEEEMERFVEALGVLGPRLGRTWTILPPGFGPGRLPVLRAFLERFAPRLPLAIEMRHAQWFRDRAAQDEAFALFEALGVAAILTDVAGRRDVLHMRLSAPDTFVRFVGNWPHPSDLARLDDWTERLASWLDAGLERVFFFLHQKEDKETLPLARHMVPRLAERTGLRLRVLEAPPGRPAYRQSELF